MTLTSAGFMAAEGLYGATGQMDKLDVSDVLAAILLKDTATLGQIAMGAPVSNIEHFYFEDVLHPAFISGTLSVGHGSCDCAVLYQDSHSTTAELSLVIKTGSLLRDEKFGYTWRVPDMTLSSTISLAWYGVNSTLSTSMGTGTATLGNAGLSVTGCKYFIVGNPKGDTATYSDDISQARTRRKNYTQVFERGIQITETREHIDLYAIKDEKKHQIKLRTLEMKRELNMAALMGIPYAAANAGTPDIATRTMSGILSNIKHPLLTVAGANTDTITDASWGTLTLGRINDLCEKIYNQGGLGDGSNPVIITGPKQARVIALLEEQRVRKGSGELVIGTYADKVKTDLGFELPVVVDRFCPSSILLILDKNAVHLCSLKGDAWHLEKMAKTGRNQGYQLSGQYTIELRNPDKLHGYLEKLSF